MRAAVIPCSARKLERRAQAAELYVGPLFRSALIAARALYGRGSVDRYLILSAAHGLITPETELEPYDVTIGGPFEAPDILLAKQLDQLGVTELLPLLPKRYDAKLRAGAVLANMRRELYLEDGRPRVTVHANPLEGSRGILEQRSRLRQLRERTERLSW